MQHPKHILNKLGIRPRKKWGQNFLINENNVQNIYDFSGVLPESNVLEIGPGLGAMSEKIIEHAANYVGVEFDPILFTYLEENLSSKQARFYNQDILAFDLTSIFDGEPFHVIVNLPYHITTPIMERLIEHRQNVKSMTLLLQKEVVARMIAGPGSKVYGRLSVWLQSLCSFEKGPVLKPGCFLPRPDVDSQVVKFVPNAQEVESAFFDFVQLLFQKRRKTIGNILKSGGFDISEQNPDWLKLRPENLSIEDLKTLYQTSSRIT